MGLPGDSVVKNLPANMGDPGSIPGSGRSLEEKMATHCSILAGEFHGQRGLSGYSSWVHRRVGHDLATEHARCIPHMASESNFFSFLIQMNSETNI